MRKPSPTDLENAARYQREAALIQQYAINALLDGRRHAVKHQRFAANLYRTARQLMQVESMFPEFK